MAAFPVKLSQCRIAAVIACVLVSTIHHPVKAQEPLSRILSQPVGQILTPAAVFLDVAWSRAAAAPAEEEGLLNEAFVAAQRDQTSLAAAAIARMSASIAGGTGPSAQTIAKLKVTEERALELELQLKAAASANDFAQVRRLSGELATQVRAIEAERAALAAADPRYRSLVAEVPVTVAEIKADLGSGEALLFFASGETAVYVFAVTSVVASWHRAALTPQQLDAEVTALRCEIAVPPCDGQGPSITYDRGRAHRLYQAVVAPALTRLAGVQVLNVVPNRSFGRFPLAGLVTRPPTGSDSDQEALRQTRWLVNDYAVAVAPSPAAFHLLRGLPLTAGKPTFQGFGDPDIAWFAAEPPETAETATRGAIARNLRGVADQPVHSPRAIAAVLGDLPATAGELRNLAEATGSSGANVHLRQQATEAAIKAADLSGTRILALATHGVLGGQVAGIDEPSLIMSISRNPAPSDDAVLSASEVARLRLDAELVVLSACDTAGPSGGEGAQSDGLAGLARAFFVSGARSMLVSHWQLFDAVAPRLTVQTVRARPNRGSFARVKALQAAMIRIRMDRSVEFAHPNAWAPLVFVGDAQ